MQKAPIMVSGYGRSGTTWMQNFLSLHSDIKIYGQQRPALTHWHDLYKNIAEWADQNEKSNSEVKTGIMPHYAGMNKATFKKEFSKFFINYFTSLGHVKSKYWGFKALNICSYRLMVDFINEICGGSKWIVCIRNPVVAYSSHARNFPDSLNTFERMIDTWYNVAKAGYDNPDMLLIDVVGIASNTLEQRMMKFDFLWEFLNIEPVDANIEAVRAYEKIHHINNYEWAVSKKEFDRVVKMKPYVQEFLDMFQYTYPA